MDNLDINAILEGLPSPKHGGGLPFKQGVINPWRLINDFELFIFTDGDACMSVESREYPCPSGQFIIMRPATRHISVCLSSKVFVRWMHFDWRDTGRPTEMWRLEKDAPELPDFKFERPKSIPEGILTGRVESEHALELHDKACSKLRAGTEQSRRMAKALFLEELLCLLDSQEASAQTNPSKPDERIAQETMERLHAMAMRPHKEDASLQLALERAIGKSYGHLERCFKRHFGMSPEKYLSGLRMDRAREMLLETAMNVSEIADALGYEDPGYFTRQFTKRNGVSPSGFRNRRTRRH